MTTNGVWVALMDTERFSWRAAGRTEEEAMNTVVREWNHGIGHERREPMTAEELMEYYGLYAEFLEFGRCKWE